MSGYRARDGARHRDSNCLGDNPGAAALLTLLIEEVRGLREDLIALAEQHADAGEQVATRDRAPEVEPLLTAAELAAALGIHARTLRAMVNSGDAPPCVRIGRSPRWRRADVDRWLESRRRAP